MSELGNVCVDVEERGAKVKWRNRPVQTRQASR